MPTLLNFSVRDISYRYLCDGFEITVTTDIPCHLYMRWTTVKPKIHVVPKYLRGIYMHGDPYFCFVAYIDNEQEEAGDTLTHTFVKHSWPVCETRWFHFWGKVAGATAPSTTAIFELHFAIESAVFYNSNSNRTLQATYASWAATHDAVAGTILPWHAPPQCYLYVWTRYTVTYWIRRSFLFFDTSTIPAGTQVGEARLDLYILAATATSSHGQPNIYITRGVQQDPVLTTDYGAQLPYTAIGGLRDIRDLVTGVYNEFPFNTTGLAFINPGGITRLCMRGEMDVADSPPPLGTNDIMYHSEQRGFGYRPLLTLCYPPPV